MKINLVPIDSIIEKNNLPEVTNPIMFNSGENPTSTGLFSKEIFGEIGTRERDTTFAYIDLHGHFLHPIAYKMVISLNRNLKGLIAGSTYYKLTSGGELVIDEKEGDTGLEYLYRIWDDIKWKRTDSHKRNIKIDTLKKIPKDEAWMTKFLVLPAGMRDYNTTTGADRRVTDSSPVNTMYNNLIRNGAALDGVSFNFVSNATRNSMQNNLVDIYEFFTGILKGKQGLIHKGLLGKTIDYSTRSVISSPKIQSETPESQQIPFGSVGVPLSQLAVNFFPFYSKWIYDFISTHIDDIRHVEVSKTQTKDIAPDIILEQFSDYHIRKMVEGYIKNVEGRFAVIMVKDEKGKSYPMSLYKDSLNRNFTLTDLLFIASSEICADKHVYVTRYPIENINNIMPCRVKVLSTRDTIPELHLGDLNLKDYPLIIPDYPILDEATTFIDTIVINNSYTGTLGADFDGDTVAIRGVFTQEANVEAERMIKQKTNVLDQSGNNSRKIGNEAVLALSTLTRIDKARP